MSAGLPAAREARVAVRAAPGDPLGDALADCLAAAGLGSGVADGPAGVSGADVVWACLPWRKLRDEAADLAAAAPDAVLVACTTGLQHDADGWWVEDVPHGSVVAMLSTLLPGRRVVGALQLLCARQLRDAVAGAFASDVPVTGDDEEALALVGALVDLLPGLDAVRLGGTRTAGAVEGLAAVVREVGAQPGRTGSFRLGGSVPTGLRFD